MPKAEMASSRALGLSQVSTTYQMIESAPRMTVPQNGVRNLGWIFPKIPGSDLCAAIDSVWRVRGSRVVSAEAAPDVNTLRNTSLDQVPPMTSRAIGVN